MIKKLNREIRRTSSGDFHTWDYQLLVQCLRTRQLTVVPSLNLILNIGFDGDGTHFSATQRPWMVPEKAFNANLDLSVTQKAFPNLEYDHHYLSCSHRGSSKLYRQWLKLRYMIRRYTNKDIAFSFD
jgi:hypothetical protein